MKKLQEEYEKDAGKKINLQFIIMKRQVFL